MAIVAWLWDFGDGFTSNQQNPTHTYQEEGTYTVSLTVTNDAGETDTETKVAYVTVTEVITLSTEDVTLRMATEPSEGMGWSVYDGDDWLQRSENVDDKGMFVIQDANKIKRLLLLDRDLEFYEHATYDRINAIRPPEQDKDSTDIEWQRDGPEHVVSPTEEYKKMKHDVSYIFVRPQFPELRGRSGYTDAGLPSTHAIDIEMYVNGEKTDELAKAENVPENGRIAFSGYHSNFERSQLVYKGVGGYTRLSGLVDKYLALQEMHARSEITMTERTMQGLLTTGLVIWLSRGNRPLRNRVNRSDYSVAYTGITGPDSRANSGITLSAALNLANAAISGGYTLIMWAKTDAPGPIAGVTMTTYAVDNGWNLLYAWDVAGSIAANLTIESGTDVFDLRLFNTGIAAAYFPTLLLDYVQRDVVQNNGRGILPS